MLPKKYIEFDPVRGHCPDQYNRSGTGQQGDAPLGNRLQLKDLPTDRQD